VLKEQSSTDKISNWEIIVFLSWFRDDTPNIDDLFSRGACETVDYTEARTNLLKGGFIKPGLVVPLFEKPKGIPSEKGLNLLEILSEFLD